MQSKAFERSIWEYLMDLSKKQTLHFFKKNDSSDVENKHKHEMNARLSAKNEHNVYKRTETKSKAKVKHVPNITTG